MIKKTIGLTGICITASFLGGFLASAVFQGMPEATAGTETIQDDIVTAKQFRLMDKNGKPRAVMTTSKKTDAPIFFLMDETGAPRFVLALSSSGNPSINFTSSAKKNILAVGTKPDGTGSIVMMGQDGSQAGSWTIVQAKDGNWYTVLKSGLVKESMK